MASAASRMAPTGDLLRSHARRMASIIIGALRFQQADWLAPLVAWEHLVALLPEVVAHHVAEHVTKIGRDGEISTFVELLRLETRPATVDGAAAHRPAKDHHHIAMSVIGAVIAILFHGAAKLG